MDVNDNARRLDERVALKSIASRLAPTGGRGQACNQVGFKAASLWPLILIWLLIFLPPREAEWRFCAVAKPAWMPV
ncbi:hypothetical protein F6476_05905 [Pseudomonas umsongensis]|nr:hypothetical protein F6476_05905 [Pseudomonas umsongensis]